MNTRTMFMAALAALIIGCAAIVRADVIVYEADQAQAEAGAISGEGIYMSPLRVKQFFDAQGSLSANDGWTPAFAVVSDGARRVLQVSDWTGGEGTKPTTGLYVGASGLTATIGDAIDIRGATGATGSAGSDGADAYVYIAYASDASGTGFTTTFNASLDYIGIKATATEDLSLTAGDFTGLWKNYKGATGATGSAGSNGAGYTATSTTSLALGTGSRTFTTQAGLAYTVGARIRATNSSNTAQWMEGIVTSYSSTSLAATMDKYQGSATIATWSINLAGEPAAQGVAVEHGNADTTETINVGSGDVHEVTLDQSSTEITFTGWAASGSYSPVLVLFYKPSGGGSRTLTYASGSDPVGDNPSLGTGDDVKIPVTYYTLDGGTTIHWLGGVTGAAVSALTGAGTGVTTALAAAANATGGLLTTDGTATVTGKTIDAADNVLKQKSYLHFSTPHRVDGTGATISTAAETRGHAVFSATADEATNFALYEITVPADLDTGVTMQALLVVRVADADSGTQDYTLSMADVGNSAAADAPTFSNAISATKTVAVAGATGEVEIFTWFNLTGWAAALTPGELLVIKLARDGDDGTNDTSTIASSTKALAISFRSTQ